jgi:phage/plasmid-associated DNA primase
MGYSPDNCRECLQSIIDTFPVGLPPKYQQYLNINLDKQDATFLVQYTEEVRGILAGIEKAGSLNHLYNILGGEFSPEYTNHLVDQLNGDITTPVINSILLTLRADDPIHAEQVLKKLKSKGSIPMGTLRKMLRDIRAAGEEHQQTEWDGLVDELTDSPFNYLSTGKRLEGYWIKCLDEIQSLYTAGIHHQFMGYTRDRLRDMGMVGTGNVNEMLQQVAERTVLNIEDDFAINRDLIHFKNGIYIISRDLFISRVAGECQRDIENIRTLSTIPFDYNPDVDISDRKYSWTTFLDGWHVEEFQHSLHLFFGDDEEQINMWWEWMGYCLTKHIFLKKSGIYHGESNSGKSELSKLQMYIFGDKAAELSFHAICNEDLGSASSLYDKHVCTDDDLGENQIKNYERFKKITGSSRMDFRFMFQDTFTAENIVKFIACANVLPPVKNIGIPFCNRWLIWFFKYVFKDDELDVFWPTRMRHPRVIDYIITKAIHHLQILLKRGYFKGMDAETVMHWWQLESNIVYKFVHEICTTVDTIQDSDVQADLYQAFLDFKETTRVKSGWVKSQAIFTREMINFGHPVMDGGKRERDIEGEIKTVSTKVYKGIAYNREKLDEILNPDETRDIMYSIVPNTLEQQETKIKENIITLLGQDTFKSVQEIHERYEREHGSIARFRLEVILKTMKPNGWLDGTDLYHVIGG